MTTTFDDRSPIIQYTGNWGQGGDPDEYRGTTTWTATVGDSARVTFTGRGISVYGAISPNTPGRGKGPVATFMVDSDTSTSTRFAGQQTGVPQRRYLMYSIDNLDYGQHILTMVNESAEGYFFVDFIEVMGTSNPGSSSASPSSTSNAPLDPSPSAPNAPSSSISSRPDPGPASSASRSPGDPAAPATLLNPYSSTTGSPRASEESGFPSGASHSLLLPPGMSSAVSNINSVPTSASSNPSLGGSGVRLDAIIGGTIGGIAATCTLFLMFVICMRKRQRRRERYGNIESPGFDSHSVSPEPQIVPTIHEKSSLPAHMTEAQGQGCTSEQRSLATSRSDSQGQDISKEALPNTSDIRDSTTFSTLPPQDIPRNTAVVPFTRPSNRVSIDPPPRYQPPV